MKYLSLLVLLLCCGCQSREYYRVRAQYLHDERWYLSHPDQDSEVFFRALDEEREMWRLKR